MSITYDYPACPNCGNVNLAPNNIHTRHVAEDGYSIVGWCEARCMVCGPVTVEWTWAEDEDEDEDGHLHQCVDPDSIMRRFEQGAQGIADIDMVALLWEVIGDVSSSYELAMQHEGINPDTIGNISNTVGDYLSNHYGD